MRMRLQRLVMAIFAVAILIVSNGDCMNLAFADAKSSDCCLREECPMASAGQMDSCCTTPPASAKYLQGPVWTSSITQPSAVIFEFFANHFGGSPATESYMPV